MTRTKGTFVFRKTRDSVAHVDVIMRKRRFFTLSEMYRALLREEYERLARSHPDI